MKQPKKLTRNQKEILVKKGMNPDDSVGDRSEF